MRFAVKVGKNWKEEVGRLPESALIHVDLEVVPDFAEALKTKHQTVVSLRPDWIGGEYLGSEADRIDMLKKGIEAGADFVEIEADMVEQYREGLIRLCNDKMCSTIIVLYYPSVPTRDDLKRDWGEFNDRADFLKLDCAVSSHQECKQFLEMCKYENLIIDGHGDKGELLGVLGGLCGFYFGYAKPEKAGKIMKITLTGFTVADFKKLEEKL